MKKHHLLVIFGWLIACQWAIGQDVQWASKVISFSSEYKYDKYPGQYESKEVLGEPSVMMGIGTSPAAYSPLGANDGPEYIQVGFETPMPIRQVAVFENFNSGTITKISLLDETGDTHEVFSNENPTPGPEKGQITRVILPEMTTYKVAGVRVDQNTKAVTGFNQIDCIGISQNETPLDVTINLSAEATEAVNPQKLGPNINSEYDEVSPVISPDGNTLYVVRQDHPGNTGRIEKQDIWYSELQPNGEFGPLKNIGPPLNADANNSLTGISPDGQTALVLNVYREDGGFDAGVSTSTKTKDGWGFPQKINIKNYYNDNKYAEYCLSNSGKILILTVQRKDSEGSKDLYISRLDEETGEWSEPESLGATLNTAASEISPFLGADDKTLYFASSGHPGYGGSDMFVSRRLDDTWKNWSKPINMGPSFNTPKFNAYYTLAADGQYAYYVSYSKGSKGDHADIFRAEIPLALRPDAVVLVSGTVLNKKTGKPLQAKISYEDLETGSSLGIANSDPITGFYQIVLPAGRNYGFRADSEGFIGVNENQDLRELKEYAEIKQDLELVPFEVGETVTLRNLFFEYDKADLQPTSIQELNRLVKFLQDNPTAEIEIWGHTDDKGSDTYNQSLSTRRAKTVYEYLVKNGIASNRLSSKGFGESKPQVPNTSDENRARNRRVEFYVGKK